MTNSFRFKTLIFIILISFYFSSCVKEDTGHWDVNHPDDSFFSSVIINDIYFDDMGRAWVGTDSGLYLLEDEEIISSFTTSDGLPSNFITSIIQDSKGHIWVGTRQSGVAFRKGGEWFTVTTDDGLADNHISCFYLRDNGDIWIGTDDAVSVYTGGAWLKYRIVNGKWNHYPSAIESDGDGNIWVALEWISGINVYDGVDWIHYGTNIGLPTDYFTSAAYGLGKMWLGTDAFGVISFDGVTWENYTIDDGLINDHVSYVFCDSHGSVWVGTNNGLSKFDGKTWSSFTSNNSGIPGNRINVINEDHQGRIWIGTNNGIGIYSEEERSILFFP